MLPPAKRRQGDYKDLKLKHHDIAPFLSVLCVGLYFASRDGEHATNSLKQLC